MTYWFSDLRYSRGVVYLTYQPKFKLWLIEAFFHRVGIADSIISTLNCGKAAFYIGGTFIAKFLRYGDVILTSESLLVSFERSTGERSGLKAG